MRLTRAPVTFSCTYILYQHTQRCAVQEAAGGTHVLALKRMQASAGEAEALTGQAAGRREGCTQSSAHRPAGWPEMSGSDRWNAAPTTLSGVDFGLAT